MPKHKTIDNPEKFLADSGLLFRINQTILHPLGLALQVTLDDDGSGAGFAVIDIRDDPEGCVFAEDPFEHGTSKYFKYMQEQGDDALASRFSSLGFIEQKFGDLEKCRESEKHRGIDHDMYAWSSTGARIDCIRNDRDVVNFPRSREEARALAVKTQQEFSFIELAWGELRRLVNQKAVEQTLKTDKIEPPTIEKPYPKLDSEND
jgi:hypothetical protein